MAVLCACAGGDSGHWIGNRSGPVPDSELLSLLKEVQLSGNNHITDL